MDMAKMPRTGREVHLRSRPQGLPEESNFELVEVPVPTPGPGEVLVRNIYMSVDPYMRGRMREGPSYAAPWQVGEVMQGGCVGQVIQSNSPELQVGAYVLGNQGWREYFVARPDQLTPVEPGLAPIQAYLGVMGMPGMTAYVGLLDIGRPRPGETVFVSAAAGAVGSVVCQIAKIQGCRVVGSAGSDAKVAWLLNEAGVDSAFNYKTVADLSSELARRCPDGIDVYFDNVGGDHLEAALDHMNQHGRIVACGMISVYNATEPVCAPRNLFRVVGQRLTIQGFIVSDHWDRREAFLQDMSRWIQEGRVRWQETVVEGIENAPKAFIGLFQGENFGKMLVKIGPDPAV